MKIRWRTVDDLMWHLLGLSALVAIFVMVGFACAGCSYTVVPHPTVPNAYQATLDSPLGGDPSNAVATAGGLFGGLIGGPVGAQIGTGVATAVAALLWGRRSGERKGWDEAKAEKPV